MLAPTYIGDTHLAQVSCWIFWEDNNHPALLVVCLEDMLVLPTLHMPSQVTV